MEVQAEEDKNTLGLLAAYHSIFNLVIDHHKSKHWLENCTKQQMLEGIIIIELLMLLNHFG